MTPPLPDLRIPCHQFAFCSHVGARRPYHKGQLARNRNSILNCSYTRGNQSNLPECCVLFQSNSPVWMDLQYIQEDEEYPDLKQAKEEWLDKDLLTLGELWIKLLDFYAVKFSYEKVVSITREEAMTVEEKTWSPQMVAIEDPFDVTVSISADFSPVDTINHFQDHVCYALKYFARFQGDFTTEYEWSFEAKHFDPELACSLTQLPALSPISPSLGYEDELTTICLKTYDDQKPDVGDLQLKMSLLNTLLLDVKEQFDDANLELFGSTINGFSTRGCDMDLNLTFTNRQEPVEQFHTQVAVVKVLTSKLLENKTAYEKVVPVTRSKIPILCIKFKGNSITADVSLYNNWACHNSKLLQTYARVDPRVQVLGVLMKHLVTLMEIKGVPEGFLSSYAYILMVIYFLQQVKPPVLPVLQELWPLGTVKPARVMNNWFFEDVDKLNDVWPEGGKNTSSIGRLLIEMLKFYTEEFDFDNYIVTIRQHEPLKKAQSSKGMVIEGRPKSATIPKAIKKVHYIVLDDRQAKVCEIAEAVGISEERMQNILHKELRMQKFCKMWVPHLLNAYQKEVHKQHSQLYLHKFKRDPTDFV
ncbi:ZCCHC11 [Cordylochernes scorpioides]|uniref:ZCCHC11 n=1 Tax=Cordylochernes scorpioides TaxID=51811 RepID=A0ABY6KST2_9ARAC|nr:ZCCHC11 [Cordylochernes scorpioides]